MRITVVLLTLACVQVSARGFTQSITLQEKNAPLQKVLDDIEKQSHISFVYGQSLISRAKKVNISIQSQPLDKVLEQLFKDQPLAYKITDAYVVLSLKTIPVVPPVDLSGLVVPPPDIHGTVTDENDQPLPGVTVMVKGTKKGTVTNDKGEFDLKGVDENAILIFSRVGMEPVAMKVAGRTNLVVKTKKVISSLDETVVTAYGTTTKRFNPGDITTITAKDIEKNPVNNVLEAIQGKVPGLFIQQVTGQPGGAFTLRLRGATNFTTGSIPPLIIVDGVRYPGSTLPLNTNTSLGTQTFLQGGNGLNYINPNDIASIDVLKDADATAIYGSAGAYGVIIITTKKAKANAPALNVNVYTGISVKGEMPKLLNTQQYVMLRKEALKNDGATMSASDKDINGTWPQDQSTDWRTVYMGNYAQSTNASASYSGGNKNTTYSIGGSLVNNGNIQRHKGSFTNGALRFSLNTATDDNKFNLNLAGSYLTSNDNMVPYDFSTSIVLDAPNAPKMFLPDGSIDWVGAASDPNGPTTAANFNRIYSNVTNNFIANGTMVYKPVTGITLRAIVGYNDMTGKELIQIPTTTLAPSNTQAAQQTHGVFHYYDIRTLSISPYAEYNKTLWKKGELSVKAGGEIDNRSTISNDISGTGFASDALLVSPTSANSVVTSYSQTPFRGLGFYGIIKYVWDHKYIIDLNGRRDGSTRFGPSNRFGNFGSVAAAWIFSEEKFMKDHASFLSYGKIRASTGVVGGDAISDYAYLSTYSTVSGTYDGRAALAPNSLANPNLEWEKNRDKEIGLELGFLKDRIFVEGNYYSNTTSNQLVSRPISTVTGFSSFTLNSDAVIRNSGWEITLNTTNIKTRDFSWTTTFNISIPTSKLLKVPTQSNQNTNFILGKPLTGILLYKYAGVDTATGYFSFTNAKGATADYTSGLTQADKTEFVDLAPKFYGGLQNSFTYKQFTLDFSFTYTSRKGKSFLGQSGYLFGYNGVNGSTDWLRRWQKPGDKTDIPRVSTNIFDSFTRLPYFAGSTGAYTDATYARLQNLSLRYRFDRNLLRKLHLKELTVYIQGQNLLTISRFGGLDPENLSAAAIPPLRVFTGGINLTL